MNRGRLGQIGTLVVVMLVSASLLMADVVPMSAMLFATGVVRINGSDVPRTSAVFRGDTIVTEASASVTISSPGSVVVLPANSSAVFKGDAIELNSGLAVISTSKGMRTRAAAYEFAPARNGSGRFQVLRAGTLIRVRAERGALSITSAGGTRVLPEGASETIGQDPQQKPDDGSQGPPPAGARVPRRTRAAVWWISGGAGAGAAAIALLAGHPHVSPVVP